MNNLPLISIIIPSRNENESKEAVKAIKNSDYPQKNVEILLALGTNPSRQRNLAAKKARGEILYFLDDDSIVFDQSLKRIVPAFFGKEIGRSYNIKNFSLFPKKLSQIIEKTFFSSEKSNGIIAAVGGPNVWMGKESFWSSVCSIFFESFFAHFKMSSRYRPIGKFRRTNEKELILCNLAVNRKIFFEVGGFKEELYPNEENEFLNRLKQKGMDLIYHPGVLVYRPRRESFNKILKTVSNYGKGRMEQIRIEGFKFSFLLFLPLTFLFYLVSLIIFNPWWYFLPLILYFSLGIMSAIGHAGRKKNFFLTFVLPVVFLFAHLSYALGILKGLFTNLKLRKHRGRERAVAIKRIQSFASN